MVEMCLFIVDLTRFSDLMCLRAFGILLAEMKSTLIMNELISCSLSFMLLQRIWNLELKSHETRSRVSLIDLVRFPLGS